MRKKLSNAITIAIAVLATLAKWVGWMMDVLGLPEAVMKIDAFASAYLSWMNGYGYYFLMAFCVVALYLINRPRKKSASEPAENGAAPEPIPTDDLAHDADDEEDDDEDARDALIPLPKAASIAFDRLVSAGGGRVDPGLWGRVMDTPGKRPRMICEILFNGTEIDLYGAQPPGVEIRKLPAEDRDVFMFSLDAAELFNPFHADDRYINVKVNRADIEWRLQELTGA